MPHPPGGHFPLPAPSSLPEPLVRGLLRRAPFPLSPLTSTILPVSVIFLPSVCSHRSTHVRSHIVGPRGWLRRSWRSSEKTCHCFLAPFVFTSLPSQHCFKYCWVCMFPGLPKKAHRTAGRVARVDATLTAIPEDESISYTSSRTPVRSNKHDQRLRSQVLTRETDSGTVSHNEEEADGERPYSPPSPYSLPSSPMSPSESTSQNYTPCSKSNTKGGQDQPTNGSS